MKTNVKTIALAIGALAGVAAAGRAPAGPDFQSSTTRAAVTAYAASDGRAAIEPLDVILAMRSLATQPISVTTHPVTS
jgi:hypothetical protein